MYVFGSLAHKDLPFTPEDWQLSDQMATYWTNFARNGDPNGSGQPVWPPYEERTGHFVMHLDAASEAKPDEQRARYEFLDAHHVLPTALK